MTESALIVAPRADNSCCIFNTKLSFQQSWKMMLKLPKPMLCQVALTENVNVTAADYTAVTWDTRREEK